VSVNLAAALQPQAWGARRGGRAQADERGTSIAATAVALRAGVGPTRHHAGSNRRISGRR
jgi:hypothetical protein